MSYSPEHPTAVRLREARLAAGIELADVQQGTKISRRYLEAIEAGEFDRCPAEVYTRGFIRLYARFLGLDAAEVVAEYDAVQDKSADVSDDGTARDAAALGGRPSTAHG